MTEISKCCLTCANRPKDFNTKKVGICPLIKEAVHITSVCDKYTPHNAAVKAIQGEVNPMRCEVCKFKVDSPYGFKCEKGKRQDERRTCTEYEKDPKLIK